MGLVSSIQLILIVISHHFCFVSYGQAPNFPGDPANPFKFQSGPSKAIHGTFITDAIQIILDKGVFQKDQLERMRFLTPAEMKAKFCFCLQEEPKTTPEVLQIISDLFDITPRPAHKYRMSKRVAGLDPLALAGDWMASTMSNLVVTYMVAPIWTMMEIKMTEYLSKKIGWTETGDMVPTSGAGAANQMALAVAINKADPTTRDLGLFHINKKLRIFISHHASVSWRTAAIYTGIGTERITEIDVSSDGRMNVERLGRELKAAKTAGDIVVMVVGTAGTPTLGKIDDLEEIGKVCETYGVWFHVDAEKGGGYLFTDGPTMPLKLNGIKRANSVTVGMWLFAAPYTSTMLLTKDPLAMDKTFGLHASYVFTGIDHYNMTYDRGDHTIQTSRRPEIAKIWFAAARGETETAATFYLVDLQKQLFMGQIEKREGFEPLTGRNVAIEVPLLSFYYVPKDLRGQSGSAYNRRMTETAKKVRAIVRQMGLMDISVSYAPWSPTTTVVAPFAFYTISFTNTRINFRHFDFIFDTIALLADGGSIGWNYPFPEQVVPEPVEDKHLFPTHAVKAIYGEFLPNILLHANNDGLFFARKNRVFKMKQPEELTFNFTLPQDHTDAFNKIYTAFDQIIDLSPHWAHPYWIYQLAAGLDPYTLIGDYISPVLNSPMLSFDDAGAFILMEKELVKQMVKRIYKSDSGDGIITDAGSMANQIAIAMAKFAHGGADYRLRGTRVTGGPKYIVYTSGDAHYSTKKGSIFQGIGINNTIEVESNNIGQMRVDKLEEEILKAKAAGNIPLMVVITTGTTIYGAIDPIDDIVTLCKKHSIWTHVDGMFGGLVAISDKHIGKFKGIERTDSWGADLHKLFGSTMVCSILITPWPNFLEKVFAFDDNMRQEDVYDGESYLNLLGRHSQMDKRNNVLKFWLLWKAKGRKGLEAHVDKIMSNKDYLIAQIKKREAEGFELVIPNYDVTNVCFRYIPKSLNPKLTPGVDRNSNKWKENMDEVAFQIEKAFVKNGVMSFVTQHRHEADGGNTVKFIKFVMMGSALVEADVDFFLNSVAYYGSQVKTSDRSSDADTFATGHSHPFDPFGNLPPYRKL